MEEERKIYYRYDGGLVPRLSEVEEEGMEEERQENSFAEGVPTDYQVIPINSATIRFNPSTVVTGLGFGKLIQELSIEMNLNSLLTDRLSFEAGDRISVSLPSFTKKSSLDITNNSFTSNIPELSGNGEYLFSSFRENKLQFIFFKNLSFSSLSSSVSRVLFNLSSDSQLYFPSSESVMTSKSLTLSFTTKKAGQLRNYPLSSSLCLGFCSSSIDYGSYLYNRSMSFSLSFSYQYGWRAHTDIVFTISLGNTLALAVSPVELLVSSSILPSSGSGSSTSFTIN
jgi:hypothetical protein